MRKLRNIAIYYVILGALSFCSFWFFKLWPISVFGIILLLVYFILRFGFKIKDSPTKWKKNKNTIWDFLFYLHPVLLVGCFICFTNQSFKQTVIIPKNYEGLVVIEYDQKDGQEKKWLGTFFGMGGSRLIKINHDGYAKTQFKHEGIMIPIIDIRDNNYNDIDNLKIYYENNLDKEIPHYQENDEGYIDNTYKNYKTKHLAVAYLTGSNGGRNVFVVCKDEDYYKYFYRPEEIREINKKEGYNYSETQSMLRSQYSKLNR